MSLFIGKNSANNNVVHITKGDTTEDLMRTNDVLPNTVFTTTQPLSSYRLIPLTYTGYIAYDQIDVYEPGFNYTMVSTWFTGGTPDDYSVYAGVPIIEIRTYSMPVSDYSYLISSISTRPNRILFLGSDYSILSNVGLANMISITGYNKRYGYGVTHVPGTSFTFGMANFQHSVTPQVHYILIIDDAFYPALSGQITINNTGLYVGNTNIFQGRKLVSSIYNPSSIRVANELYLVDTPSSGTGSGLELVTSPNVSIKVGGIELFNSSVNSFLPFKPSTKQNITRNIAYSINTVDTLLYTMSADESFCIVGMAIDYVERITTAYSVTTKSSSAQSILGIELWSTGYSGGLRVDFTYLYTNNGKVYIRTIRRGGSAPTSTYTRTFSIEAF